MFAPAADSSAVTPHEDRTVWIVEDSDDYRQTIRDLIDSRSGYRCAHAFGACEEALAMLNKAFAPEMMLMDIGLPGMSGVEGVRRIKQISPSTQVVMLTIHEDNDTIFQALCAGATGYLLKMSPTQKIFEALEEVSRGGAPMNGQIARRVLNMFTQLTTPRWDYQLTDREKEILELLVGGRTKNQIADALFLSYHTVDTHLRNIYAKLHVNSRSDAVVKALRERLI